MKQQITLSLLLAAAMITFTACGDDGGGYTTKSSKSGKKTDSNKSDGANSDAGDNTTGGDATQVAAVAASDADEGYGHFKGRFTLTGAPAPKKIDPKGNAFCGKFELIDPSVQVNSENNGLANVGIWLYAKPDDQPEPHESYADVGNNPVLLDNKECLFDPQIVVLKTGQQLDIHNSDADGHNTNVTYRPSPFNINLPPNATESKDVFNEATRLPARVACNIHPWMSAWIVVNDTPYVAVTDKDGSFEIKNLPVGTWTFQVWHETPGYVRDVNVGGKDTEWERGRIEVNIESGKVTDLGEVKLEWDSFNDDE